MPKNNKLDRYKDPLGLTAKKMNFGLWYVRNRKYFVAASVIILILISIISWFWTTYNFTYYITKGIKEDEALLKELVQSEGISHDYILQIAPKDLQIGQVKVFSPYSAEGKKRFDILVKAQNINQRHWAYIDYSFLLNGEKTKTKQTFILPGETKYISLISQKSAQPSLKALFNLEKVNWSRVSAHAIPDWKAFRDDHLNIQTQNIKFLSSQTSGLSEQISLNLLDFEISNNTPYNYWNTDLTILFYQRGNIIGATKHNITEFLSGETRKIQISIPGRLGQVTGADIIPEINIIRDDIYMKYE